MQKKTQVADLHCDLLCYLQGDSRRTVCDAAVRCSLIQMLEGGVQTQILPIFTITEPGSSLKGWQQAEAYVQLCLNYSDHFITSKSPEDIIQKEKIALFLAVENGSSLFEEEEPLAWGFKRLEAIHENLSRIVYISPTWNSENRFGGGSWTDVGLKEDGKSLLHFLHGRGIAYDCSHNSDLLLQETMSYIDSHQLDIPLLASHSNMRAITNVPRNLPDPFVREILDRGGIIGLNFYKPFVGAAGINFFAKQLEHVLKLGGENQVCLGADFFYDEDLPIDLRQKPHEMFYPEISDSSSYPFVFNLWQKTLDLPFFILQNIASKNLLRFLSTRIDTDCKSSKKAVSSSV